MIGMFQGLWTRLSKRNLLLWTYGALAAAAALITTIVVAGASEPDSGATGPAGPPGATLTPDQLIAFDGQLLGLSNAVTLLGIVAVVVGAGQMASEYSSGTLRNLLIRQPQRWRLLAGWWAALATFMVGAVLVAATLAGLVAQVAATGRGFDTGAWYSADGLVASIRTVGLVAAAIIGYATIGMILGVVLRAPIPAIAIGVGWLLALELALAQFVDGLDQWLPGQLLGAVAGGGTDGLALDRSAVIVAAYLVVGLVGAAALFSRRDVTA